MLLISARQRLTPGWTCTCVHVCIYIYLYTQKAKKLTFIARLLGDALRHGGGNSSATTSAGLLDCRGVGRLVGVVEVELQLVAGRRLAELDGRVGEADDRAARHYLHRVRRHAHGAHALRRFLVVRVIRGVEGRRDGRAFGDGQLGQA